MSKNTKKLCYAAVCLALAMVLPFLTGQIPQIGQALSPMHLQARILEWVTISFSRRSSQPRD